MQVEALKRELTEENRCILRDRLAEKGQAPAPPAPVNKTREVDYVGFANLPNQVYRRAVKKGFEFTLMVVGESGLGKSTLINSMFLADIYSPEYPGPSHRIKKTACCWEALAPKFAEQFGHQSRAGCFVLRMIPLD